MDTRARLNTGGRVTLDINGNGAIILRPDNAHQRWMVKNTVVQVSTNTLEPQCFVYVGQPMSTNAVDSTYTGSNDTSNSEYDVPYGSFITVQWIGGDPGAIASVAMSGDMFTNVG